MDIETSPLSLEKKLKSEWKQEIKKKLVAAIEKEFSSETEQKTKLRFQRGKSFGAEEYVEQCDANTCQRIMNLRLNMVQCKANYKNMYTDLLCVVCNEQIETTEHLFVCTYYKQFFEETIQPVGINELKSVKWLTQAAKVMETIQEIRQQHIVIVPALKGSKI